MDLSTVLPDIQSLDGSRVLVTGGSAGIGRAVVLALAAQGARVITFAPDREGLDSLVDEAKSEIHALVADVSDPDGVRRVFAEVDRRFGGLDILINNAGITRGRFLEQSLEEIETIVRTNVVGYLSCAREAAARMKDHRSGHVVLVGSMSADLREPEGGTYVATKAAIQAFAESLRKDVNEHGIRVTLIEPGKVATDMVDLSDDEKAEHVETETMLRPEDIATAILFALVQPERCDIVSMALRPRLQII